MMFSILLKNTDVKHDSSEMVNKNPSTLKNMYISEKIFKRNLNKYIIISSVKMK